jgi:hypothetical protein
VSTNPPRAKRAPAGLGARGKRYWSTIQGAFELSDSEQEVLLEVCRTLDSLDALDAAVTEQGAVVRGSAGQPVVNPAITEARGMRALLHRLMAAMALPDEDGATMPTGHSQRGKAANAARWRGHVKDAG